MTHPEPWGKLSRRDDEPQKATRLSLVAHCIDVAAVTSALLNLPTWRQRLDKAAGCPLSDIDRARLSALAFLHDVGKAGAGFYAKAVSPERAALWRHQARATGSRIAQGHVQVVAPLFVPGSPATDHLREAIGFDQVLAWGEDEQGAEDIVTLWLAAISHHGTPVTWADLRDGQVCRDALPSWVCPIDDYEPLAGLRRLAAAVHQVLPTAFASNAPPLRATPMLVHAFAGLVSLADWIGSNTQPNFFPFDFVAAQDEARWPAAQQRATEVLRSMRLDVAAAQADLQSRRPSFESLFDGHAPRAMQQVMGKTDLKPLVVVEAETGSGKTEAALWRFKTLFETGAVDALCFLLPTRVSATAIGQRVQRFIDTLFPDPALRPNAVLAVPGYLRANGHEGSKALAGFEVLWPDEADPNRRPMYWAAEHSKRYFAAACATATIDQFLLSTLQTKHAHLRGTAVLRALVVVDEVHASDAYMTALLRAALARHVRAGGHGLLMSATLTGEARASLVQAGQAAAAWAQTQPTPLAAADAPYPAVTDVRGIRACAQTSEPKLIHRRTLPAMRDPEAVAALVAQAVADGARVLVIRNTVGQAVATQAAIERLLGPEHPALFRAGSGAGVVAMHHGRYAFEDRRCLDQAVEAAFGKSAASATQACVLVGTQTLEISLDCDADLLITDIVPIDVLLQRLGRLHRHRARDPVRPTAYRAAQAVVLTPAQRDLAPLLTAGGARGLGIGPRSAYENLLAIEAALRLVEDTASRPLWHIPEHNRELVEAGADSHTLATMAEAMGGQWPLTYRDYQGKQAAQKSQAAPVLVRWDLDWDQGRWSDLGDEVRTRLGLDSIDLDLLQPWTSPLHQVLTRLSVPRWMLPPLNTQAPTVARQTADGDALLVTVADRTLRYDRLGLRAV